MLTLNQLLAIIITFLLVMILIMDYTETEYTGAEYIETEVSLRTNIQENFLQFYEDIYCKDQVIKTAVLKSFGTQFNVVHCHNGIILILDENNLPTTFISDGVTP